MLLMIMRLQQGLDRFVDLLKKNWGGDDKPDNTESQIFYEDNPELGNFVKDVKKHLTCG